VQRRIARERVPIRRDAQVTESAFDLGATLFFLVGSYGEQATKSGASDELPQRRAGRIQSDGRAGVLCAELWDRAVLD